MDESKAQSFCQKAKDYLETVRWNDATRLEDMEKAYAEITNEISKNGSEHETFAILFNVRTVLSFRISQAKEAHQGWTILIEDMSKHTGPGKEATQQASRPIKYCKNSERVCDCMGLICSR